MRKATKTQVARKGEIERRTPKIFGCAICSRLCGGSGHSAWPIFPDGICCDTCKESLPAPAHHDGVGGGKHDQLGAKQSRRYPHKENVMDYVTADIQSTLTHEDITDFLAGFASAIELDQMRVDALPDDIFHPAYDDGMWRRWRQYHLDFINQLLPTVNKIPASLLQELARLAITYETAVVQEAILHLFGDAASDLCPGEQFETAALFFGWLPKDVSRKAPGKPSSDSARSLMMRWLAVTDPLRIGEDSECGYRRAIGFMS
jgi:hypothetical protein